jgi:dTDP-4-dehydrorhamnose reductase
MRILITGTTGQIGSALVPPLASLGKVLPVVRRDLDLGLAASIEPMLDRLHPNLIINPAAYTAVDRAEDEPELARAINAVAPGVIARWAAVHKVPFIHFSTDYVFDGSRDSAWREQDPTQPLSVYGVSKLEGEKLIRSANGPHLIVRTSWVYAARGQNFLCTIARLAAERDELRIVNDQVGAPTSARSIAKAIAHLLAVGQSDLARYFATAGGIVHLAAAGETSWHGFASEIVKGLQARGIKLKARAILPIATKDYPTKAVRPRNSRLALDHLAHSFGIIMPDWKESLKQELDELARQKLDSAS